MSDKTKRWARDLQAEIESDPELEPAKYTVCLAWVLAHLAPAQAKVGPAPGKDAGETAREEHRAKVLLEIVALAKPARKDAPKRDAQWLNGEALFTFRLAGGAMLADAKVQCSGGRINRRAPDRALRVAIGHARAGKKLVAMFEPEPGHVLACTHGGSCGSVGARGSEFEPDPVDPEGVDLRRTTPVLGDGCHLVDLRTAELLSIDGEPFVLDPELEG